MRYELGDYEWRIIKPLLPNKPRSIPRVNDRRVLNKIKQCRRIATRYDKLTANYLAFIKTGVDPRLATSL
jgi:transposase